MKWNDIQWSLLEKNQYDYNFKYVKNKLTEINEMEVERNETKWKKKNQQRKRTNENSENGEARENRKIGTKWKKWNRQNSKPIKLKIKYLYDLVYEYNTKRKLRST